METQDFSPKLKPVEIEVGRIPKWMKRRCPIKRVQIDEIEESEKEGSSAETGKDRGTQEDQHIHNGRKETEDRPGVQDGQEDSRHGSKTSASGGSQESRLQIDMNRAAGAEDHEDRVINMEGNEDNTTINRAERQE
ncbi:hypothetical protein R1sor_002915 [Riccia sorocarpa]|uniref:Uncharacterized protein n=1 Tax=Riccia sorocarpa TaxID=122646 RepID=A0ABD3H0Y3_9MARC